MSKYGVFSGPYFLVFELNTGKYGPEKAPYLDIFRVVVDYWGQECNTANIILFSTNQIADILYVSDKNSDSITVIQSYSYCKLKQKTVITKLL